MSALTVSMAGHILDSAQTPAAAFVPTNLNVSSQNMPLGVILDIPSFASSPATTVTGTWMIGGLKASTGFIPLLNTQSTGSGYSPIGGVTGPMTINPGNSYVSCK